MPPDTGPWLLYGATGYTGRLVAALAASRGHRPILAARDAVAVAAVAGPLGLPSRAVGLEDTARLRDAIADVAVVAHCAGPFSTTSRPMIDACLAAGAHYVDITGEIDVFEAAAARHEEALAASVVLCPGVGFDVIPTDCLAATLAEALPEARRLALGFETASGMSAGTAQTTIEALPAGGRVRRNGRLERIPLGSLTRTIDFGGGPRHAVAIPWGDLATAYRSTGIGTIEVYVPLPRAAAAVLRGLDPLRGFLGRAGVQRWLKRLAARTNPGPDARAREARPTLVWGEARDDSGRVAVARVRTANVYDVTAAGVLLAVEHLLGHHGTGGFVTPSQLLGPRCVEALPGSGRITLEVTRG